MRIVFMGTPEFAVPSLRMLIGYPGAEIVGGCGCMSEEAEKNNRLREVIRFALTGGICFLIELAALVLLRDRTGLDTLIAAPIAFLISVIVNYLLCVRWVFDGAGEQGSAQRAGFLITSAVGLGLNELLMLLFRALLGEDTEIATVFGFTVTMYMVNKVMATVIVMVWNYFTKKWILARSAGASRRASG